MRAAVLLVVLGLAAGAASAQTADKPRPRRRVIPAAPALAPAAPPSTPAVSGRLGLGAAPGLSGLRPVGDGGAGCRGICARSRYACEVQGDSCAPAWTDCLKVCSTNQGVAESALLPR